MRILFTGVLFLLCLVPPAFADIFRYVDESGVVCYTDAPVGRKAARVLKEEKSPAPDRSPIIRTNSGSSADYHEIVHEKASAFDVDPSLIKAVIKTESNWNCRAISSKGAMGLMQLMPSTANDMNVHNPFDPEENIEGGTKYLKYLIDRFNGDLTLALAAYNAGPKTVEKFGYVPPITETKQYVKKVLSLYNGKATYMPSSSGGRNGKSAKSDPIYKVVLEDGTVLFTNSSLLARTSARF